MVYYLILYLWCLSIFSGFLPFKGYFVNGQSIVTELLVTYQHLVSVTALAWLLVIWFSCVIRSLIRKNTKIYFSVTKTVTFELVQRQVVFTCHIHKLLPYSANILFLGVGKRTQYSPHKLCFISENREYPSSHIFLGETPIKRNFFNNFFKNGVWNAKLQNYDKRAARAPNQQSWTINSHT